MADANYSHVVNDSFAFGTTTTFSATAGKASPQVILKKPHAKDCWAAEAVERLDWYSPWYVPSPQKGVFLDRNGGHRGETTHWFEFQCNSFGCSAWGLFKQSWVDNMIHDELRGVRL